MALFAFSPTVFFSSTFVDILEAGELHRLYSFFFYTILLHVESYVTTGLAGVNFDPMF